MTEFPLEDLMPHRNGMKLIDEVIEVNDKMAITASVVSLQWPLFRDGFVDSLIVVELVAQTAGVYVVRNKADNLKTGDIGWLVGIKKAVFHRERIPLNTRIVTSSVNMLNIDTYMKISGTSKMGNDLIGEVNLQIFWSDGDSSFPDP